MTRVESQVDFDAALEGHRSVVLFHATWCPFCRVFVPVFLEAVADLPDSHPIEAVLDDEDNPLWDRYSIRVVPTVLFLDGGAVTRRLDGRLGIGLNAQELRQALSAESKK